MSDSPPEVVRGNANAQKGTLFTRRIHRWVSLPFSLFMLFMGITGTLLALDDMTSPKIFQRRGAEPMPWPPAMEQGTAVIPIDQMGPLLDSTARLLSVDTEHPIVAVKLFMQGPNARAEVTRPGGGPAQVFDVATGQPVADSSSPATHGEANGPAGVPAWRLELGGWLEYLHRGAFASWPGVIIVLLTGIALTFLSITGLMVYVDMFGRRRKNGRSELFWN